MRRRDIDFAHIESLNDGLLGNVGCQGGMVGMLEEPTCTQASFFVPGGVAGFYSVYLCEDHLLSRAVYWEGS